MPQVRRNPRPRIAPAHGTGTLDDRFRNPHLPVPCLLPSLRGRVAVRFFENSAQVSGPAAALGSESGLLGRGLQQFAGGLGAARGTMSNSGTTNEPSQKLV